MNIWILLLLVQITIASLGDHLPEFIKCNSECYNIECSRNRNMALGGSFTEDDLSKFSVSFPFKQLFGWDCQSDCDYKCQQLITNLRTANDLPVVKFNGKWAFLRVFGITELMSVIFSGMNFYINFHCFKKIKLQYNKNRNSPYGADVMLKQYLYLLGVSLAGWVFSILFHIRDYPLTETLDYFGALLIILANFYVITVRYFQLFMPENKRKLQMTQIGAVTIYCFHLFKLSLNWNYSYNVFFNSVIGLSAMCLWMFTSFGTYTVYRNNYYLFNNSIQLLPFETKILMKLNYLRLSKSRLIPLIPIGLNLFIIFAMGFEIYDFKPILKLVDAHSLWHLLTFFPPIIWYDWNIWDLELFKLLNVNKMT